MKDRIILAGGGGHCKVIIDAIRCSRAYSIYGIVDSALRGSKVLGVSVIGDDKDLNKINRAGVKYAFIAVGSVGNCDTRNKIDARLRSAGFKLGTVKHPSAVVAADVNIGEGAFIAAGAVINPGTEIGRNVIVNTSSSIDHDCLIGDFVHIAPGAVLSGGVKIGSHSHVGTGASIVQCIELGRKAFVCAGSVVTRNIKDNGRYR